MGRSIATKIVTRTPPLPNIGELTLLQGLPPNQGHGTCHRYVGAYIFRQGTPSLPTVVRFALAKTISSCYLSLASRECGDD